MKNFSYLRPKLPTPGTPHAAECMEKIREMLSHPKPPGNWWEREVLEKMERGEKVSMAAYDLAKAALAGAGQRVPGQDDEEAA